MWNERNPQFPLLISNTDGHSVQQITSAFARTFSSESQNHPIFWLIFSAVVILLPCLLSLGVYLRRVLSLHHLDYSLSIPPCLVGLQSSYGARWTE